MRCLQLAEARVDEHLALLGHVVLGVFAEVAQRGRFFDLGGKFVRQLMLEPLNLFQNFFLICSGMQFQCGSWT